MPQFLGFGDGSDGDLTVSVNMTDAPIDSACTGTSGTKILSATNASFAANQLVFIHQSYGSGAGAWELAQIDSYVAGTITLKNNLVNTYSSGAQVLVMKQYNSVVINSGKTVTGKSYDGTVGGIIAWLIKTKISGAGSFAHGGVTGVGSSPTNNNITVGGGFRGGGGWRSSSEAAISGDGSAQLRTHSGNPGGNAGGAGYAGGGDSGGGGGGNGGAGSNGSSNSGGGGTGGATAGSSDLTTMLFGGGGGGGRTDDAEGGHGGSGGGIIFICCDRWALTGSTNLNGGAGYSVLQASGGGGAGGSCLIKARTAVLGSGLITALGGAGGTNTPPPAAGGDGGVGRIRVEACSITGDSNPSASQSAGGQSWCANNNAIL